MKPKFIEKRVLKEIHKTFPNARISSYKKFKEGLVNPTYKVKIISPNKFLAVKIYKQKNLQYVDTGISIMKYLYGENFPVPIIYSNTMFTKQGVVVMEYLNGKSGLKTYNSSTQRSKQKILLNSGKIIKEIHNLKAPAIWVHPKHNVENKKEWIEWTKKRVEKYNLFIKRNMPEYSLKMEDEFNSFLKILREKDIAFVPMHWDFHLSNILVNDNQEIVGIFDFDNAMKGDSLAELAQFKYWLRLNSDDWDNFKYLIKGYGLKLTPKKQALIRGYLLLHLIAVNRSIWKSKRRLSWLIKKQKVMLDEILSQKY